MTARIISLLPMIWLNACATMTARDSSHDEFSLLWSSVIISLNQGESPFSSGQDDLEKIYQQELAALKAAWSDKSVSAADRALMHEFFHDEISKRNGDEIAKVKAFSQTPYDYSDLAHKLLLHIAMQGAGGENLKQHRYSDQIGYCFGRALLVHYLLQSAGLPNDHIFKIFVLGRFMVAGKMWRFHVATMAKSSQGLIVIDPLFDKPLSIDEWMKELASREIKHPLSYARFYVTDPRQFMPSGGYYSLAALMAPPLRDYFYELGRTLKR